MREASMNDPQGGGHPGTARAVRVHTALVASRVAAMIRLLRSTGDLWPAGLACLVVAGGAAPIASLFVVKELVDGFLSATAARGDWATLGPLLVWMGVAAAILLVQQLIQVAITWVRTVYAERLQDRIIGQLHEQSTRLDLSFFETPNFFDRLHRARDEATYRPAVLVQSLVQLLESVVTVCAMSVALTALGLWLPLALVLSGLPVLYVVVRFGLLEHQLRRLNATDERRAWYLDEVLTSAPYAGELRLFDLGARLRDAHARIRGRLHERRLDHVRRRSLAELVATVVGVAIAGGAGMWMAGQALVGAVSPGQLAASCQAFARGLSTMRSLLGHLGGLYANTVFLDDWFVFLALEPAIADPIRPRPLVSGRAVGIRFIDVTFRYPGAAAPVLDRFNLEIRPGTIAALVGPNGAGKSTLIKLLTRLYDPESGVIELDGVDIRDYRVSDLRLMMTVLFQEPVRYWQSAGENVAIGASAHPPSEVQVQQAVAAAGASSIIEGLADGYHTVLGRRFGEGAELSTGEWQRLALARALVRECPMVLLDEPTSALDPWSEADWFERFRAAASGRTCILITHRLHTARQADVVCVMEHGRVVRTVHPKTLAGETPKSPATLARWLGLDLDRMTDGRDVAGWQRVATHEYARPMGRL